VVGHPHNVVGMRAAVYDRFGDESVLRIVDDHPEPPVGPDVVLVRAHAAGVNPVDITIREGLLAGAFPHHFPITPGWDLSGVVERVGPAVIDFVPGDGVFGYVRRDDVQWGTAADLVPVPQRCLAHKPESLGFAEAGALPLAGLTAYQALTEVLDVGEGDRVLVHRASGGVGFFAVQIAVALGAHVIGTASPRNHGFLRDAGAAEVLDYAAGPASSQLAESVDAVFDLVGGDTLADAPKQVRDPARIASVVDPGVLELGGRYVFVRPDQHDLEELGRMADAGQLRVPIAKAFPLEQIADAHRLVAGGHVRGKVVVTL
jgi:NADPH:quinone reductase-like Zn-dependent oxidoreductase